MWIPKVYLYLLKKQEQDDFVMQTTSMQRSQANCGCDNYNTIQVGRGGKWSSSWNANPSLLDDNETEL